jgi:hypothetical protein
VRGEEEEDEEEEEAEDEEEEKDVGREGLYTRDTMNKKRNKK